MIRAFAILLLACFFLQACGGTKPVRVPELIRSSDEMRTKADDAYGRGDLERALKFYAEALRLSRSMEDTEGTAGNLLDIAVVYRGMGDLSSAHIVLDEVFIHTGPAGITYPENLLARGCMIRSLLHLDAGSIVEASEWSGKAESLCKGSRCADMAGILNLQARVMLLQDNIKSALAYASRGMKAARSAGDGLEEANSLRIMADSELAAGRPERAIDMYEDALVHDKALALPGKVALDLRGLAVASIRAGYMDKARTYLGRALDVSMNAGLERMEEDLKGLMEAMEPPEK